MALRKEGIGEAAIHVTGNTSIDALLWVAERTPKWKPESPRKDGRLVLVTAHRRENFGEPLRRICQAVNELARRHPEVSVLYPVHLNPHVQRIVHQNLARTGNVVLCEPLRYDEFVSVMKGCYLILTDSGGVQEEAAALGKPVLVLRGDTERSEAVEAGTARVVGTRAETIVEETERLLNSREAYRRMAHAVNVFGDGLAAKRIVDVILAGG
jgi:UDP-N-acetylglucosamine 2-epimerase (non-hydrolysing)